MCDELGDTDYMRTYVEEAGQTSTCSAATSSGCSKKEVDYIEKMKASSKVSQELARLLAMDASHLKENLVKWLRQRIAILKQLITAPFSDDRSEL